MDYYEFMEKANTQVTQDEYADIEYVYLNGPHNIIGGYVTAFCEWYNANGGMKAIYEIKPFVKAHTDAKALIEDANAKCEKAQSRCRELEAQVGVYEELVSVDDLLETLEKKATREDLVLLLAKLL